MGHVRNQQRHSVFREIKGEINLYKDNENKRLQQEATVWGS